MLPNADDPNVVEGAGVAPKDIEGAGVDPNVEEGVNAPKLKEGAGVFDVVPKENPLPLDDGAGVGAAPKENAMISQNVQKYEVLFCSRLHVSAVHGHLPSWILQPSWFAGAQPLSER